MFVLRPQDELPPGITHLAWVGEKLGDVKFGTREEILKLMGPVVDKVKRIKRLDTFSNSQAPGEVLVDLKNLGVTYGDRVVLEKISWRIREGERWILKGHNGSGKSTLLSLVLGDHPSSFTFGEENITLFGKPRIKQATSTSQSSFLLATSFTY
jgi:ATPase subunit of ABC transporter with duplicated ATPase domains